MKPTVAFVAACAVLAGAADAASAPPSVAAADRSAILQAAGFAADAKGSIENECGEKVAPKFAPVALGGGAGDAVVLVIEAGPNTAGCYGDGPDLRLMKREAQGFREIFAMRGGMLIVLPRKGATPREIARGGPGFAFPLLRWNGVRYAETGRSVSDEDIGGADFFP